MTVFSVFSIAAVVVAVFTLSAHAHYRGYVKSPNTLPYLGFSCQVYPNDKVEYFYCDRLAMFYEVPFLKWDMRNLNRNLWELVVEYYDAEGNIIKVDKVFEQKLKEFQLRYKSYYNGHAGHVSDAFYESAPFAFSRQYFIPKAVEVREEIALS